MLSLNKLVCFLLLWSASISTFGQSNIGIPIDGLCSDLLNPYKRVKGVKYINKKQFKYIAILLRDSCNPMNRFSKTFVQQKVDGSKDFYYPWLLIDSATVEMAETFLKSWVDAVPDEKMRKPIKLKKGSFYKYIRDYAGFIDHTGNRFIVIQFLTKRQFTRHVKYNQQFDLFAMRSKKDKLRLMILKIHDGMVSVHSIFV